MRPNISCISNHPSTHPGTETGKGPYDGINSYLFCLKYSSFRERGDLPLPFKPYNLPLSALHIIAKNVSSNPCSVRFNNSKNSISSYCSINSSSAFFQNIKCCLGRQGLAGCNHPIA